MNYRREPLDLEAQELERQKTSQRRINILLLVIDLALLGYVIYEVIAKLASI